MFSIEKLPQSDLYQVTFIFSGCPESVVALTGSFIDWDPEKLFMKYCNDKQAYIYTIELPAGCYEYKFIIDGEWMTDLDNTNFSANDFGTLNSVLNIG